VLQWTTEQLEQVLENAREKGLTDYAAVVSEERGIHTLTAHQRANLPGLGAQVGGLQNAAPVGIGERATPGTRHDFGIAAWGEWRQHRYGRIFSRPTGVDAGVRLSHLPTLP
jgi:hypothetical protein